MGQSRAGMRAYKRKKNIGRDLVERPERRHHRQISRHRARQIENSKKFEFGVRVRGEKQAHQRNAKHRHIERGHRDFRGNAMGLTHAAMQPRTRIYKGPSRAQRYKQKDNQSDRLVLVHHEQPSTVVCGVGEQQYSTEVDADGDIADDENRR